MAAVTTSSLWLAGATISACPICDDQRREPRGGVITTGVATAAGLVTLTHANLIAGTQYRAIGLGPDGVSRCAVFIAA
jgi:hypothetical protein